MNIHLRVSSILERTIADGPGERFVLWVQGCTLVCPGCFSPETHPLDEGDLVSVDEIADRITSVQGIEGVTFSGGEPMLQAAALAELSRRLKNHGLTIMCYTGFTLSRLRAMDSDAIFRFLTQIDILVDGPFIREQAARLRWRGSRNQRVHYLTDKLAQARVASDEVTSVEFVLGRDGFTATGIWPPDFLEQLEEVIS